MRDRLYTPDQALDLKKKLSLSDQAYFDETMDTYILGSADECVTEMHELAGIYGVDELMIVNVTYSFDARKRTYKGLAEAFNPS